ncbi:sugar phosphate isomerase/epimerase family protein [Micromonospora endolithica]|uniref:Sugar phosphate isomerase/epimerase n=1 Tax=Micromonospora endolithica TaxID=230091 RepID=A0A3A9ZIK6_9ACTN|nr:sugar phosphate isomerase/epimerase family protein [Micromonospora endolithica]RKN47644.1 sugar phosphate isomerase/epimerase [Micromonospora endolithica]TWJ21311.1 ribosomal protein S12 methylthiotransferase accessory factor [Micromonospora endolithica]
MSLRYAYNTNGLTSHRLDDALALLADCGYDGVSLTLDVAHHDPYAPDLAGRTRRLAHRLDALGLASVVETGARFLLDPRRKHHPTLVSPDAGDRSRRRDFLRLCVDVAVGLGSEAVSFWAGVPEPGTDRDRCWHWLVEGVRDVVEYADRHGVTCALEPEPGMLVDDCDDWARLAADVPGLTLALDTGHCLVSGRYDPAAAVRAFAARLGAVAVEDMPRGRHEHRAPGEGDLDFPAVLGALTEIAHPGLVSLELSRDAHRADTVVPAALAALRRAEQRSTRSAGLKAGVR